MCHFETGTYFSISILFVFFFRFRLPLRTFWRPYRAIFSIFCLKWQEIAFFSVKYSQILLKLRNSLLEGAKIPDILPKFLRFPDEQERILSIKFKIKSCSEPNFLQNPIITFLKTKFGNILHYEPSRLIKCQKKTRACMSETRVGFLRTQFQKF